MSGKKTIAKAALSGLAGAGIYTVIEIGFFAKSKHSAETAKDFFNLPSQMSENLSLLQGIEIAAAIGVAAYFLWVLISYCCHCARDLNEVKKSSLALQDLRRWHKQYKTSVLEARGNYPAKEWQHLVGILQKLQSSLSKEEFSREDIQKLWDIGVRLRPIGSACGGGGLGCETNPYASPCIPLVREIFRTVTGLYLYYEPGTPLKNYDDQIRDRVNQQDTRDVLLLNQKANPYTNSQILSFQS